MNFIWFIVFGFSWKLEGQGFPGGRDDRVHLRCRIPRFDPWVGKIPWGRKWRLIPVFLPREFHRQRSLVGYSLWSCTQSDTTEWLTLSLPLAACTDLWPHGTAIWAAESSSSASPDCHSHHHSSCLKPRGPQATVPAQGHQKPHTCLLCSVRWHMNSGKLLSLLHLINTLHWLPTSKR